MFLFPFFKSSDEKFSRYQFNPMNGYSVITSQMAIFCNKMKKLILNKDFESLHFCFSAHPEKRYTNPNFVSSHVIEAHSSFSRLKCLV